MKLIKDYIRSFENRDPYKEDLWQEGERPIITSSEEMTTRNTEKEFLLSRIEDLERRVDSLEKTKESSNEN